LKLPAIHDRLSAKAIWEIASVSNLKLDASAAAKPETLKFHHAS
jgi:hypothetical protein